MKIPYLLYHTENRHLAFQLPTKISNNNKKTKTKRGAVLLITGVESKWLWAQDAVWLIVTANVPGFDSGNGKLGGCRFVSP